MYWFRYLSYIHTKLTASVVQAQQVLDGIQHKVESEIGKGMDCLAQAKAELQVCTPCCITLHAVCIPDVFFVTHLACIAMGISTAVFVTVGSYVNPFGVVLFVLPASLCIQAHVDKPTAIGWKLCQHGITQGPCHATCSPQQYMVVCTIEVSSILYATHSVLCIVQSM